MKKSINKEEREKQLQDDDKFVELFRKLNSTKKLTMSKTNDTIQKYYPDLEFLDKSKKTKVYVRHLVFWKIKTMWHEIQNLKRIYKEIDDLYPKLYKNLSSRDNFFTKDIRQPVLVRFKEGIEYELAKEMVALTDDEKAQLIAENEEKLRKSLKNITLVNLKEMLSIIENEIKSEDPMRRAVVLMMCCGSRAVEFFSKASYTVFDFEGSKSWVSQKYIAKKKGDPTKKDTVIKPIIHFTNEEFIRLRDSVLQQLHKEYEDKGITKYSKSFIVIEKDKETLASVINTRGNEACKKVFNNREGFTLHTTRALYAVISYELFGRKKNYYGNRSEFRQWISDSLGKEGADSATGQYAKFELVREEVVDKTQEVNELKKELKECREECKPTISPKIDAYFQKIKEVYDQLKVGDNRVKKRDVEDKLKGIVPRSRTRQFFEMNPELF